MLFSVLSKPRKEEGEDRSSRYPSTVLFSAADPASQSRRLRFLLSRFSCSRIMLRATVAAMLIIAAWPAHRKDTKRSRLIPTASLTHHRLNDDARCAWRWPSASRVLSCLLKLLVVPVGPALVSALPRIPPRRLCLNRGCPFHVYHDLL